MTNDEFKKHIASKTGIPMELLTGATPEENLSLTASLLAFKRETAVTPPKSASELFCDWFNNQMREEPQIDISAVIDDLRETAFPSYPKLHDGGEITTIPDPQATRDQFEEWARCAGFGLGSF